MVWVWVWVRVRVRVCVGVGVGVGVPLVCSRCIHDISCRLTEKVLRENFHLPLSEVAKKFGMCTTAFKKLCRKQVVFACSSGKLGTFVN